MESILPICRSGEDFAKRIATRLHYELAGSHPGLEVRLWEITVDLTISDLRELCIWNSGDPPKNI
jgi:hypothetical protein